MGNVIQNQIGVLWRAQEAGVEVRDALQLPYSTDTMAIPGDPSRMNATPLPTPVLPLYPWFVREQYDGLRDERIAFIGAGAGTILVASYLVSRGAQPENMTAIDPRGTFGGIWNEESTLAGGFNNPAPLRAGDRQLAVHERRGELMRGFLQGVAADKLKGVDIIPETATRIDRDWHDKEWRIKQGRHAVAAADTVIIAAGAPVPRTITGPRIWSNLDKFTKPRRDGFVVERQQRRLTTEELESGRPIVLIGLGNSTAYMLNQIQWHEEKTGKSVDYHILTDLDEQSLRHPERALHGRKSLYRKPKEGYLTGFSGDLDRDRQAFERARDEHHIHAQTATAQYDPKKRQLQVGAYGDAGFATTEIKEPHIFALVGFEPDKKLIRRLGSFARLTPTNARVPSPVRPCDGALWTLHHGYNSNVFVVGSHATTYNNPNAGVLPGIMGVAPALALTMGVRSSRRAAR
jgi:hypothetical protein